MEASFASCSLVEEAKQAARSRCESATIQFGLDVIDGHPSDGKINIFESRKPNRMNAAITYALYYCHASNRRRIPFGQFSISKWIFAIAHNSDSEVDLFVKRILLIEPDIQFASS